ncbi:MAG: amino acid--[acyl-carrier-protein] ligase [Acidimicrobiales bacterium]
MTVSQVAPADGRGDAPGGQEAQASFRAELLSAGLLVGTGVDGLYGRSEELESIVGGIDALVTRLGDDLASASGGGGPHESLRFPPVLARWVFDRTDYMRSFPDLMGSVHTFRGSDRDHARLLALHDEGGDWPAVLTPAEVVVSSASCHPLYPMCTGRLAEGGRRFEVNGWCFRCEPSVDPTRQQAFRMQELVYVGEPDAAQRHRDAGLELGLEMLAGLGLPMSAVAANDPFFGRLGTMLAASQLDEALKIEGVTPVCSAERPTAIMSGNCHRDHFGKPFGISTAGGAVAHSACVAFGVDRVALALVHRHGLHSARWPAPVRAALWP